MKEVKGLAKSISEGGHLELEFYGLLGSKEDRASDEHPPRINEYHCIGPYTSCLPPRFDLSVFDTNWTREISAPMLRSGLQAICGRNEPNSCQNILLPNHQHQKKNRPALLTPTLVPREILCMFLSRQSARSRSPKQIPCHRITGEVRMRAILQVLITASPILSKLHVSRQREEAERRSLSPPAVDIQEPNWTQSGKHGPAGRERQ